MPAQAKADTPLPVSGVQNIEKSLTYTAPSYPDYRQNYEQTVVVPAEQAAQQAAAAAAAAQAQQRAQYVSGSCGDWMAAAGISNPAVAYQLIMRESGCNPYAVNRSSGACGIGQQLPCGKWPHQWNDPVGGMIDMQNYVYASYGSWANAWYHECSYGWY